MNCRLLVLAMDVSEECGERRGRVGGREAREREGGETEVGVRERRERQKALTYKSSHGSFNVCVRCDIMLKS